MNRTTLTRQGHHNRKNPELEAGRAQRLAEFAACWRQYRRLSLVARLLGISTAYAGHLKRMALAGGLITAGESADKYRIAAADTTPRRRRVKAAPNQVQPVPGKLLLDDDNHELVHGDGRREPAPPGLAFRYDMRPVPGSRPLAYELQLRRPMASVT